MADDTDEATGDDARASLRADIALAELKFHHDRIAAGSDLVGTIGQFIFVIFGVIIVGASRYFAIIIVLPLFWTAWLFYSAQREADTSKHALLARRLEGRLNDEAGAPLLAWNSALTAGAGNAPTPLVTVASVVYWAGLYAAAWIASIVVFFRADQPAAAIAQIILFVALAGAYLLIRRDLGRFAERCDDTLAAFDDRWSAGSPS